jgi:hypothetical protein
MTEYYIAPKTQYGTPDFNHPVYHVDGGYTNRADAERTVPLYVALYKGKPEVMIVEVRS